MSVSSKTKVRIKRISVSATNFRNVERLINEELDNIECLYITNIQCMGEKTLLDPDSGLGLNLRFESVFYVTYVVEDLPQNERKEFI